MHNEPVNILLVDDQPAKLLSYETILSELGENLVKANSAREAFTHLLGSEIAVVLVDVCMPELDGFELAAMIREHPRFEKTAIIFISAVLQTDFDRLRGYQSGAVDYVHVPIVPDLLRAKVRVFAELYRKTRQLQQLNRELERRVTERTAALEQSMARLRDSEQRRTVALAAGRMGSWDFEPATGACRWDEAQSRILGLGQQTAQTTVDDFWALVHPDDRAGLQREVAQAVEQGQAYSGEFRIVRPDGGLCWCAAAAAPALDADGRTRCMSGVMHDITERKRAEEQQRLLLAELNHRVKNTLATVQSIAMQTLRTAESPLQFEDAFMARILALSAAHDLLTRRNWDGAPLAEVIRQTLAPYANGAAARFAVDGPAVRLSPNAAVTLGMAFHELATNAAKYGALSADLGRVDVGWVCGASTAAAAVEIRWTERNGPAVIPPSRRGFGSRLIERGLAGELDAEVALEFAPTGVECRIRLPLSEKVSLS